MPSPLVFFQIATPDPAATRAFFTALFDWTCSESTPGFIDIDPGGPADFDPKGQFMRSKPGAAPFVQPFWRVSDLAATVARALELGATTVVAPTRTAAGTDIAILRSPEGLSFGVVQA